MKKILVYMATYNGEKYLAEQLDSIMSQEDVFVSMLIADDCSTDNTYSILTKYAEKYENIQILKNSSNLGYKKNFLTLIHHDLAEEYDYFALADQDDIWNARKLISAINFIECHSAVSEVPMAYSSNLQLVDEHCRPLSMMNSEKEINHFNPYNLMLENKCTGCTLVFNDVLRQKLLSFQIDKVVYPHDELICRIAILTGQYFFDRCSYIQYRQHGNNLIGANKKKKIKKYISMLLGKKKSLNSQCFQDILETYEEDILPQYQSFIYLISKYKTSFSIRIKILFSKKFRKATGWKTFIFKFAVLLRKY